MKSFKQTFLESLGYIYGLSLISGGVVLYLTELYPVLYAYSVIVIQAVISQVRLHKIKRAHIQLLKGYEALHKLATEKRSVRNIIKNSK